MPSSINMRQLLDRDEGPMDNAGCSLIRGRAFHAGLVKYRFQTNEK